MTAQIPCLEGLPSYTKVMKEWREKAIATNKAAFDPFKNCFAGRDVVILGSGPTSRFFNFIDNAVYIGVNSHILSSSNILDYYFCLDYTANIKIANEFNNNIKKFYGKSIKWPLLTIDDKSINDGNAIGFYTNFNECSAAQYNFTDDIATNLFDLPKSTIFAAVLFCLYGNASRIYIVGCDCAASKLDKTGTVSTFSANSDYFPLIEGWKAIKKLVADYYRGSTIISINPRGLKGIFQDVYQNAWAVASLNCKDVGEYAAALKRLEKALAIDPENTGLISEKTELLLKLGRGDEAIGLLELALAHNAGWAEGYKLLADILAENRSWQAALDCLAKGVKAVPGNVNLQVSFALGLRRSGHLDEVRQLMAKASKGFKMLFAYRVFQGAEWNPNRGERIAIFREAMSWCDEWPQVNYMLCMDMRSVGELGSMEQVINASMALPKFVAAGHRLLAWAALDRGQFAKAMHHAREMWRANPVWDCTPQLMLQVLIARKRYSEALTLALEIEAATPGLDYTPYFLSRIYEGIGELDTALKYAEQSVTTYPIFREFYRFTYVSQYVSMLRKSGQYSKAEEFLLGLLEFHKDQGDLWRQLSSLRVARGNRTGAIDAARRALAADPANAGLTLNLVTVLQGSGQTAEAEEILDARLRFTPNWSQGWRKKAELTQKKNNHALDGQRLAYARKAYESDPENILMLNFYTSTLQNLSIMDAVPVYEKYLAQNPGWPNGWVQLHRYYRQLNDLETALKYARGGVENAPDDLWNWVGLIDTLLEMKELDQAELEAQRFLANHPDNGIAYRQMAWVWLARAKEAHALQWLRKGCFKSPGEPATLWEHYIKMLHNRKLFREEQFALEQALKHNPHWLPGWQKVVNLVTSVEDKIAYMQKAMTLNPAWTEGWKRLAAMTQDEDDKRSYLLEAAKVAPDDMKIWEALLDATTDKFEKKDYYKTALKYHPHWADGYYRLSQLYSD